jgi:hypothetical protein
VIQKTNSSLLAQSVFIEVRRKPPVRFEMTIYY